MLVISLFTKAIFNVAHIRINIKLRFHGQKMLANRKSGSTDTKEVKLMPHMQQTQVLKRAYSGMQSLALSIDIIK